MSSDDFIAHHSPGHFRILGSFWAVYGVIRLIMVLCLVIYGGTATLMFGALLNRVPNPFALMDIFHFVYAAVIVLSAVCGLVGLAAGLALIAGVRSGRKLALIAAILSVSDVSLGLSLGIYTLVELLPIKASQLFMRSGQAA